MSNLDHIPNGLQGKADNLEFAKEHYKKISKSVSDDYTKELGHTPELSEGDMEIVNTPKEIDSNT